jgi:hypothetical protein
MLAIGMETLPLVATPAGAFGMGWIATGEQKRWPTALFGVTLAAGALVLFALSIPPSRWMLPVCDALSPAWLWLAVAGGGSLTLLASMPQPARFISRAVCAFGAAIIVCGVFLAAWPNCLAGPYAAVDPLVRDLWLSGVGEARPLLTLVVENPAGFLFFAAFILIGWAALALAVWREARRKPELVVALAFASIATVVALAEMRGAPFAAAFCLFGWLYILDCAFAAFAARSKGLAATVLRGCAVAVALIAALPFGWSAIGEELVPPPATATDHGGCRTPADMAALASEPPGMVLAPIRLGPRILLATPHSVLGAPYHRNNAGNRTALEMLVADSATAERLTHERGISYIAICLDDPDLPVLESRGSDNLIKALVNGSAPAWLAPIIRTGPIHAWALRSP